MKSFKQSIAGFALLLMGFVIAIVIAEALASLVLPRPVPNKMPFIRMQADRDVGYLYRPNQKGFTLDQPASINRWGFRGEDWPQEKKRGVKRIALLGDSYVYGHGVDDETLFAKQLDVKLGTETEVFNFAVSGYDLGHEIEVLKKYVLPFKPDGVVLHFFINDVLYADEYGHYEEMFRKEAARFSKLKWSLREVLRRSRVVMTLWDYLRQFKRNPMSGIMKAYLAEDGHPEEGPEKEGWEFTIEKMNEFYALSRKHGFKAVFVVIPSPYEILQHKELTYQRYLIKEAEAIGLTVISLSDVYRYYPGSSRDLLIPYDNHFSEIGNERIAEVLAHALKEIVS